MRNQRLSVALFGAITLLLLGGGPAITAKEDAPERVKQLIALQSELRPPAILEARQRVKSAATALGDIRRRRVANRGASATGTTTYQSSSEKATAIANAQDLLDRVKKQYEDLVSGETIIVPDLDSEDDYEVGAVGIYSYSAKVVQVVSPTSCIVSMYYTVRDGGGNPNRIVGGSSAVRVLVWLEPYDTRGMTDSNRESVQIDGTLLFTGKKTYANAAGTSSTVLIAKPVDIRDYLAQ